MHELEVYGFTVLPEVLDPQTTALFRTRVADCDRQVGVEHGHRGTARHVANLPTLDQCFHQCIDHPKVLPLIEHFLEPSLILGSLNARIVRPGDGKQGLHGDIPQPMLNMASPVMMNTIWMLDDFNAVSGGTWVVPGSHKSGLAEPRPGFAVPHQLQTEASAGSVLVINGQCWHGGGANTGNANRHALFGHYRKHMLMFQWDPHDDFPAEWWQDLSPRQRQLMRMQGGVGEAHAADMHLRLA